MKTHNITRNPVTSSQIKSVGHCSATNTLSVEFKSGGVYHYHDVPADKHAEMLRSDSIGNFLHKNIKGQHQFTKV